MSADKKSSLVQIAQAVLDEATQSVKVRLDSQSIQIHVELDTGEDSVTLHQAAEVVDGVLTEIPWVVEHITEPVATALKQDLQLAKSEEIRAKAEEIRAKAEEIRLVNVDIKTATDEAKAATILAKDATLAVEAKVSTEAKQDSQIVELQAIKGHVDGVEGTLTSVDGKLYSTDVAGNASLHVTVDNQTEGLATEAKQDSQITELQAIKGHVDQVEAKLDSAIAELVGLNAKSARLDAVHTSYFDYGSTNVTNAAWVELTTVPASVEVREIAIFDSSGEVGEVGVVQNAVDNPTTVKILIFPGGNQPMPITLAAGDILKIRAKSNILSAGACIINFYGVSTL